MTLKSYSAYRETDTEWLGLVPATWTLSPLGTHFRERKGAVSDADFPALSVTKSGVVPQLETAAKTDHGENRKQVEPGDFVINSRSDRKGSSGTSKLRGSVSTISIVLEPRGLDPRFVHHLLRSEPFQEEFYRFGSGIVADLWSTRYSSMKQITLAVPSAQEQRQIADYLDAQTAKIDALIRKQEQLIEKLAERRQAVISHAVTKGLDPNAPMKDSGQKWLGQVPRSWRVTSLKRTWRVIDCKHVTAEFVSDGIPLASIREAQSKWVDLSAAKQTTEAFYWQLIDGGRRPRAGDLIFTRNATVGAVSQVPVEIERFAVGQDVCILRSMSSVPSSDYQQYLLQSWVVSAQIETLLLGSTFKRINVEQIRDFILPVPGGTEQSEIAEYLDNETAKIDALSAKAREMIDILKERRQALISAAVTGKIDVRGLT